MYKRQVETQSAPDFGPAECWLGFTQVFRVVDSLRRRPADGSLQVGRVRDARATRADGGERTGVLELVRCMTAQKSSAFALCVAGANPRIRTAARAKGRTE